MRSYETEMLGYGFAAAANSTKPFFADAMRRVPSHREGDEPVPALIRA